ncbi:uncharacterized protein PG986_002758 [Apiospora aurea]|uniref:Uncharacterized protein n=1 Tax=Apiospora aurea TaxID=335848 RepID=A0ABR1QQ73_9PEZI
MLVKLSVGFALLRLCASKNIQKTFRYAIWALMGCIIAYTLFAVTCLLAYYRPIEANWNKVPGMYTAGKELLGGSSIDGQSSVLQLHCLPQLREQYVH